MKKILLLTTLALIVAPALRATELNIDPQHIDVYITPYYNSAGPTVNVGKYSAGLASADETTVIRTVAAMKERWKELSFAEMYVAAIRLYDCGYRKAATYWYYSAEYRGRLFTSLVDRGAMGGVGDPAYEVLSSQTAFYRLVGPYINGYSFGDLDLITRVLKTVQREGRVLPDMRSIYPNIAFKDAASWDSLNAANGQGMDRFIHVLTAQHDVLMKQRAETGVEAKFGSLGSKDLPGGDAP